MRISKNDMKLPSPPSGEVTSAEGGKESMKRQESYVDIDLYGRCSDKIFGKGAEQEMKKTLLLELLARREEKAVALGQSFIEYDLYGRADPRVFGKNSHFLNAQAAEKTLLERKKSHRSRKSSLRALLFPIAKFGRLVSLISKSSSDRFETEPDGERKALTNKSIRMSTPTPKMAEESSRRAKSELPCEEPKPYITPGRVARAVKSLDSEGKSPDTFWSPVIRAASETTRKPPAAREHVKLLRFNADKDQAVLSANAHSSSPQASDMDASESSSQGNSSSVENVETSCTGMWDEEKAVLASQNLESVEQPSLHNLSNSSIMQDQSVRYSSSTPLSQSEGYSAGGQQISQSSQTASTRPGSFQDSPKEMPSKKSESTLKKPSSAQESTNSFASEGSKTSTQATTLSLKGNHFSPTQGSNSTSLTDRESFSRKTQVPSEELSPKRSSRSSRKSSTKTEEGNDTEKSTSVHIRNFRSEKSALNDGMGSRQTSPSPSSKPPETADDHTTSDETRVRKSREYYGTLTSPSSAGGSSPKQALAQQPSFHSDSMLAKLEGSSGSKSKCDSANGSSHESEPAVIPVAQSNSDPSNSISFPPAASGPSSCGHQRADIHTDVHGYPPRTEESVDLEKCLNRSHSSSSRTSLHSSANNSPDEQTSSSHCSPHTSESDSDDTTSQSQRLEHFVELWGPLSSGSETIESHSRSSSELERNTFEDSECDFASRDNSNTARRKVESERCASQLAQLSEHEGSGSCLWVSQGEEVAEASVKLPSPAPKDEGPTSSSKSESKGSFTSNFAPATQSHSRSIENNDQGGHGNGDRRDTEQTAQIIHEAEAEEDEDHESYKDALDGVNSGDSIADSHNSSAAPPSSEVVSTSDDNATTGSNNRESSEYYSRGSSRVQKDSMDEGSEESTSQRNEVVPEVSVGTTDTEKSPSKSGPQNESVSTYASSGRRTNIESRSTESSSYSQVFESTVVEEESDDSDVFLMALSDPGGVHEEGAYN